MSLKTGSDEDRWEIGDVVAVIVMILVLDEEELESAVTDNEEGIDLVLLKDV